MRYITRTIKSVIAITKCVNLDTMEVEDVTLTMGNIPPKNLVRAIEKRLEGSNYRLVKVINTNLETNLYKITEEDFMLYATIVE